MEEFRQTIIKSLAAGFLIGLGGTAYLAIDNKIIASFMFSIGLLVICVEGYYLFTGKVSYTNNVSFLLIILGCNLFAAFLTGEIIAFTQPKLIPHAIDVCRNKMAEGWRVIPLGILCNVLIYFAVEGYKRRCRELVIMCVMAFILCGFEHSIANTFYFSLANVIAPWYILLNIIGNAIGGVIIFIIRGIRSNDGG